LRPRTAGVRVFGAWRRTKIRYRAEKERAVADLQTLAANAGGGSALNKLHPQCTLLLQGHLFDSKFINTAFDVIEKRGAFEILDFLVVPNLAHLARESQMVVALSAPDGRTLETLQRDLVKLGELLGVRVAEVRAQSTNTERTPNKYPIKENAQLLSD
jgi:hypothetical protein